MVTVGYYRYCLFCCVLLCAILELTSGATNCTIEIMNFVSRINCSVWENVPNNTLVFDAVEIDSWFIRNLRYKIIDGNIKPQHFDIILPKRLHKRMRLHDGQLRTRGDFDRENMSSLQHSWQPITWWFFLSVKIYGIERVYLVNINVLDINDNTPTFSRTATTILSIEGDYQNVNLDESVIPTARDADEKHNGVKEYLLEDDYGGLFMLNVHLAAWEDIVRLMSTRPLDREEQPSYDLVLIARDGGNKTGTLNITLKLIDVNDNKPVVVYIGQIVENSSVVQPVVDINATDKDSGVFGTLTYSINMVMNDIGEDITGDNIFSINTSTGEISTNAVLDRELVSNYCLIIAVRDGGNYPNTVLATVEVQVVDINDNPPQVNIDLNQDIGGKVSENLEVGTSIATMTVTDPDEDENGLFSIGPLEDLNTKNGITITNCVSTEVTSKPYLGPSLDYKP